MDFIPFDPPTAAEYHGSIAECHGEVWITGHDLDSDRFFLTQRDVFTAPECLFKLRDVRRESFTITDPHMQQVIREMHTCRECGGYDFHSGDCSRH